MGLLGKLLGPPSEDAFVDMLIKEMRTAGDDREFEYDKNEFQLRFSKDGKDAGLANLRNVYSEYCTVSRSERKERLRVIVRSLLAVHKELPDEFEDARPDLLPLVRCKSYLEFTYLQGKLTSGNAVPVPNQEIGDHLLACVGYDLPETVVTINDEQLETWGVSFYEAIEAAIQNLSETEFAFAGIGDCFYGSATGDNYDASRLLLNDLVGNLEIKGSPVAMVPNRDTLLITGSDDVEGLGMMADLAEKALEDPRPMSAIPLRLNGDQWESWMPATDHPQFDKFHLLELKTLAGEYADQKSLLDQLHEQQGNDLFVATFTATQKDTGEVTSYCVWSDGVDTLLPRTDRVMFFREGEDIIAGGEWDRVLEVVGDMMQPLDDYPPRFRVTEFPTDEQRAMIGNAEM